MLKPQPNSKMAKTEKTQKIKLGQTFYKLEKGEETVASVAARKKAEKEARRAEVIRKGGVPERTDPFASKYTR